MIRCVQNGVQQKKKADTTTTGKVKVFNIIEYLKYLNILKKEARKKPFWNQRFLKKENSVNLFISLLHGKNNLDQPYLIFVISFTQTGFSKTKFYTQKND